MSFFRGGELSLRLQTLKSFHLDQLNIWDIGCDHGKLGFSFINDHSISSINLVDPSEKVINDLNNKVKASYITAPKLNVFKCKGQDLKIKSKKNSIFIAGMGGKEIWEIISNILPSLDHESQFIISPHKNILMLRNYLHDCPITLRSESLIYENNQFYQILVLSPGFYGTPVSKFGSDIWKGNIGERYRLHLLHNYSAHQDQQSKDFLKYLKSLGPFD